MKDDHRSYNVYATFAVAKRKPEQRVAFKTAVIILHLILHSAVHIYHIQNFIIILSRVYNEPIQRPVPSLLVSLIGSKSAAPDRRGCGFESRTSLNYFFSGFLFATAKVVYITAMIILHLISLILLLDAKRKL